jgi:hypothetical protein
MTVDLPQHPPKSNRFVDKIMHHIEERSQSAARTAYTIADLTQV